MKKTIAMLLALAFAAQAARAEEGEICEITVSLAMDEASYVAGERLRGVVDVKNFSQDTIKVDGSKYDDRLFIEVFVQTTTGNHELERIGRRPFVSRFRVGRNEGQRLETLLADHFSLAEGRYLARPVLVHGRIRYEGEYKVFDVVPGVKVSRALQMFANRKGLSRQFELVRWVRRGHEHLFLTARDKGTSDRRWQSTDVGLFMKMTPPTISILPTGEVVVIHRADQERFVRSEFWSLPDALEFRSREAIQDPETAGQAGVQEMYRKAGGVKAAPRPWWKFW